MIERPNACGKSNLLNAFRFLQDIAKQKGGVPKIHCLSTRKDTEIAIDISFADNPDEKKLWR
ncbi:MAG: ATP-binding protein [Deltaproteobacteria bacterium]|nr:ATP-binding protein [Deltaproteobacteria bacterium]